jgi:serine/threonine-protein kinase
VSADLLFSLGDRIADRYTVRAVLGSGAMGAVYEVEDEAGVRRALKAALPDLEDGGQLLSELTAAGPMPPRRALVLTRQILDGVEHAHERGVVHRDLKPENVLVTAAGAAANPYDHVKLLDFGLVKLLDAAQALIGGERLTRTGIAFGTPAYIAPETALGKPVDGRADLYTVGVMLFEMLAGRLPFLGDDPVKLLRAHVSTPAPRLSEIAPRCPPALDALCATALAKRPDDRYATATAMRAALDDAFLSLQS